MTRCMQVQPLRAQPHDERAWCCAGFAVSSVVWLQRRTGLGFQLWDCGLFTVARVAQRYWFVGALNTWLPVPVTWMATLVTHSRSLVKVWLRG